MLRPSRPVLATCLPSSYTHRPLADKKASWPLALRRPSGPLPRQFHCREGPGCLVLLAHDGYRSDESRLVPEYITPLDMRLPIQSSTKAQLNGISFLGIWLCKHSYPLRLSWRGSSSEIA